MEGDSLPERERMENCFMISRNYGRKLKELMMDTEFEDENEEIDFFRNVKPGVACYIEYFRLISEALAGVPAEREAVSAFWMEEKQRFQLFRREYESFVNYFESGGQQSDAVYFLRKNNDLHFLPNLHIYDSEIDWCTSHDRLVRNYQAYKKYDEYCNKKLYGLAGV